MMNKCEICLEEYREGDLELHQGMCVVRLMFRCTLCYEDFSSKEGLWNHLDLHEVVDESKESHYQEIKAKHKLHQCALCNDQRVYLESQYWKHIEDIHNGFFLQCSDCGEQFRSEAIKDDHILNHSRFSSHPVASNATVEEEERVIHVEPSLEGYSGNADKVPDNSQSTKSKTLPLQLACDVCGATFSSNRLFVRHKRSCEKKTSSDLELVQKHGAVEMKKPPSSRLLDVKCSYCGKMCSNVANLRRHFRETHKPVKCTTCGTTFEGYDRARYHKRSCEKKTPSELELVQKNGADGTDNPSSNFKCSHCGKECSNSNHLRRHFTETHREVGCQLCGTTFQGYYRLRYHKLTSHAKYECAKCSLKFHTTAGLERHSEVCEQQSDEAMLNDNGPEVVVEDFSSETTNAKCSHCGIGASSADTLTRHILIHHEPVACDFCGITFPSLFQVQAHAKRKHKLLKLGCPHCSKHCQNSTRLRRHISKCGIDKFPCRLCGKLFKSLFAADRHTSYKCTARNEKEGSRKSRRNVRKGAYSSATMEKTSPLLAEGDESQTKCHYCGEEHSSPGYLTHHLKINHKLTKCDICGITVFGLSAASNHKLKSHSKTRYDCTKCRKKFVRKREYEAHSFVCENTENSCELCGRTFKKFLSMKKHNERYHPEGRSLDDQGPNNFNSFEDQTDNMELQLDIKVEDTMLQEVDCHVTKEDSSRSSATTSSHRSMDLILGRYRHPAVYRDRGENYVDSPKDTAAHTAIIMQKIQRWMTAKNIKLPGPHAEVVIRKHRSATVKCWHCLKHVGLSSRTNMNGSWYWIISNFTKHIADHMKSRRSRPSVKRKVDQVFNQEAKPDEKGDFSSTAEEGIVMAENFAIDEEIEKKI